MDGPLPICYKRRSASSPNSGSPDSRGSGPGGSVLFRGSGPGESLLSIEADLQRAVLERRRGWTQAGERSGQHDGSPLAVDPDDQLGPDLLQRDLALAPEGERESTCCPQYR